MTPTGAKPIAELAEGELVLAYNEATGHIGAYPITAVISHVDPEIALLTIDDAPSTSSGTETLQTTAEHPFYELEAAPWLPVGQTEGRWTDALELKAGDRIWQADGSSGVVQAVKVVPVQQRTYNLPLRLRIPSLWVTANGSCPAKKGVKPYCRLAFHGEQAPPETRP